MKGRASLHLFFPNGEGDVKHTEMALAMALGEAYMLCFGTSRQSQRELYVEVRYCYDVHAVELYIVHVQD